MSKIDIVKNNVHITINDNEKWGVMASHSIMKQFFLELSGIETNHFIVTFNDQKVLDNEEYFSKRLYIDFKENTLSTLNYHRLKEGLRVRYNLDFDEKIFQKYVSDFMINKECTIDYSYHFTLKGKALANFALAVSVDKEILIINNPTIYQDKKQVIDDIVKELTDKPFSISNVKRDIKERITILGLDKIDYFSDKLDKIIFINDKYDLFVLNPMTDNLIMIDYFEDYKERAVYINQGKMFLLDNLEKIDYRILQKNKINSKVIKVEKIGKYLLGDDNG